MGRTLGPFADVSTARVDGAYEIYRGADDDGREVEILTLGASSSRDPARRALLSDTVAWAHATRGPADASILSADLDGDQPYVVTLRQNGMRGVERMLERMLAMGPSSGPLSGGGNSGQFPIVVGTPTGHIPVVNPHSDPHGLPRAVSTPPSGSPVAPASPMAPYVTKAQHNRPPWVVPSIVGLLLLILVAGGFFVFYGMAGENPSASGQNDSGGEPNSQAEDQGADQMRPNWNNEVEPIRVVGETVYAEDEGEVVSMSGWPFAFKVAKGLICEAEADMTVMCLPKNQDAAPWFEVRVRECPDTCNDAIREELVGEFDMPGQEREFDADTRFGTQFYREDGAYEVGMTRFFEPRSDRKLFATVLASGGSQSEQVDELNRMINGVATQTA